MNLRTRTKHKLSIFVVMVMILQMLAPIGGDVVRAEGGAVPGAENSVPSQSVTDSSDSSENSAAETNSPGDGNESGPSSGESVQTPSESESPKETGQEELAPVEPNDSKDTADPGTTPGETDNSKDTGKAETSPGESENPEDEILNDEMLENQNMILAEEAEGPKDLGNIFTDVKIILNEEEIVDGATFEIEDKMNLRLEYQWELDDDVALNPGDWSEIAIPDLFELQRDEDGDLLDVTTPIGQYFLTKSTNMLKVVFNDELVDKTKRSGEVWAQLDFDLTEFEESNIQTIEFNTTETKNFTIKLKPQGGELITKTGEANADLNASNIEWAVDINTSLQDITNAVVTDYIPEGLEVESIEIYNLNVARDGTVSLGEKVAGEAILSIELGDITSAYRIIINTKILDRSKGPFENIANLTGTVGDESINESAEATVETPGGTSIEKLDGVADDDRNAKTITWRIKVNEAESPISNAKVRDTLEAGLFLHKDLASDEYSVKIYKLTINPDASTTRGPEAENASFTYDEDSKEMLIDLGDIESAYEIEYKTDIKYESTDEYGEDYTFNNTATLTGEDDQILGESSATATVSRGAMFDKSGKARINPDSKTIDWTLEINEAEDELGDVWVEDKLGEGMQYIAGSLVVKDKAGNNLTAGDYAQEGQYSLIKPGDDRGDGKGEYDYKLKLGNIKTAYTVTYSTEITNYDITDFKNQARISWIPMGDGSGGPGTGGEPGTQERIYIEFDSSVKAKIENKFKKGLYTGLKGGQKYSEIDYKNKTMSWKIDAKAYKGTIIDLKIVDTFPNNGLVFLEDTLVVEHKVGNTKTILTKGTDYTVVPNEGSYGKGFIIELQGRIPKITTFANSSYEDSEIKIYYSTSFDPNYEGYIHNTKDIYKNEAKITGNTEYNGTPGTIDTIVKAKKQINTTAYRNGKKSGKLNRDAREIDWKIYINYMSKNIKPFVITDTLSEGQSFNQESFLVKPYSLGLKGNIIVGNEAIDSSEYQLVPTDEGFTLTFPNGITSPFLIEYKTNIEGISQKEYINTAKVKDGSEYNYTVKYPKLDSFLFKKTSNLAENRVWIDDEINWELEINESLSDIDENATIVDQIGAGLVYVEDSVEIYKQDNTELSRDDYTVSAIAEGDETKLTITFNDRIKEKYTVKYKTVVVTQTGSVTNKANFKGTKVEGDTETKVEITVKQSSGGTGSGIDKKGSIIINKVDPTGATISSEAAEFKVYYMLNGEERTLGGEGNTYKTIDGKLQINNLNFRTYYIEEVTAPYGFEFDADKDPVEVLVNKALGKDGKGAYEIAIENTPIKTEVTGTKIWAGGPEKRPTIELQLYRNGAEYGAPVPLKSGTTQYTWKDLNLTDNAGGDYVYTVNEVGEEVPQADINGTKVKYGQTRSEDLLTVTNTYNSPITDITGRKVWVGGSTEKPSIELQLYRNGEALGETVKLENGTYEYVWKDLDITDKEGVNYKYTIDEVQTPTRYVKTISEDGLTITNRYRRPSRPNPDPVPDPEDPEEPTPSPDPEDPDEEDPPLAPPETPTDPIDPEDPIIPTEPEQPGEDPTEEELILEGEIPIGGPGTPSPPASGKDKKEVTGDENAKGKLPKTGESSKVGFYLAGLALILGGLFIRRKVKQ